MPEASPQDARQARLEARSRAPELLAQILRDLGVRDMILLSNTRRTIIGLEGYGLDVVERVPLELGACEHNAHYLRTKKEKMGHRLCLDHQNDGLCAEETGTDATPPAAAKSRKS